MGKNLFQSLWVTLSCSNNSLGNALEMSNKFYETGLFASSDVDFMFTIEQNTNDNYFGSQWPLNGNLYGINYAPASAITQGNSDIIVAVIDDGIQLNHPDLPNVPAELSYDIESNSTPSLVNGSHGTSCAGIIGAATNNGIGVASIAPGCRLMSISYPKTAMSNLGFLSAGFHWAVFNNASVISNSWSIPVNSNMLYDAIKFAIENGRNGKGCVVVFSSGNANPGAAAGPVGYPANSHPDILAIGASDNYGSKCDFSHYGSELDVVAPGYFVPTTTTESSYETWFSGTSAACPHVSALAALVLSVNSELKQKEVANIIEKSARKLPGYSFSTYSGRPNGKWNNEVGYGLLDAHAALLLAQGSNPKEIEFNNQVVTTNTTVRGEIVKSSNVVVQNNANLTINADQKVDITLPFTINAGSTLTMTLQ